MLVPLQGAAQGAAVGVLCSLWSWPAGAAAGCCFRVLSEWCVCVWMCVWVGVCVCARFEAGAASGALLLEWRVRFGGGLLVPLQGAASGCCCCSVCAV